MLCELFKNNGSSGDKACYRDIMLGDVNGKQATKELREILLPYAHQLARPTQFGSGLNGGETGFAHLYIRLITEACKAAQDSIAVLYIDVTTAFAVLLRRIIFDCDGGDEKWLSQLKDTGFPDEEVAFIYASVCSVA